MRPVPIRSFAAESATPNELVERKGAQTISVCLPARNEEPTVGTIVEAIRTTLMDRTPLVDELLVVDDHSTDGTADVAASAGAKVVDASEVLPEYGVGHGKGEALWKSLFVSSGDLVVWCDSDIREFDPMFVSRLVAPLLVDPAVAFVKGFYDRPVDDDHAGGGRVTELVARPLVSLFFPQLASMVQPLAGEYGGRRSLLERLPFVAGYGVDIALLLDAAALVGADALAQVDLGVRLHRNRSLDELGPQAAAVLQAIVRRVDPSLAAEAFELLRPGRPPAQIDGAERPPLVEVPGYRR